MRRRPAILGLTLALGLAASAAHAAEPMSAEAFEAYVTGKTLTFANGGGPYGVEEYLPGREVRWAFIGEECVDGRWYPQGEAICFAYEGRIEPQCWFFYDEASGIRARPVENPEGSSLYEIDRSDTPMICPGPRIGV